MKKLIKNGVVVSENGEVRQDLLIENGVIARVAAHISDDEAEEVIDANGCYVMPGGIDVHTHFNIDVGIARSCDDFLPAHAQQPAAVQQPLLTIWALGQRDAICITS